MGYCTNTDVTAIVETDMDTGDIDTLIAFIDGLMDLRLDTGSLSVAVLLGISQAWTAYRVMLKDPASERIGDISSDRSTNLKLLKAEYEALIDMTSGIAFLVGKAAYIG